MKRKTIRKHFDFICPHDCLMARGSALIVKTKPLKIPCDPRYGLVVSKRDFKLATERNHVKRLLRDWIAYNEDLMLNDFDYVFIANRNILSVNRETGRQEIKNLLNKISKKFQDNEK
nr:ribonuclease P protein component [Candidatus Enterousia merdequi]